MTLTVTSFFTQVKAWLTNWQAAIEQQQSRLASQELLVQLQRQGEVSS